MATFRGLFVRKDSSGIGTGPADARKALAGLIHRLGSGAPRQGLLSPVQVVGTTGWAYSVPAAWWVTSRGLADGVVLAGSDGVVSVPTDPAPASGSRIDIIYVLHRDVDQADPDSASLIAVAKGVASGSPVAPAIPAGAMEIARATVSSTNANTLAATISQTAPYTGLPGADIVAPFGQGEFAARIPDPPEGQRVYSLTEGTTYVRRGGAWQRLDVAQPSRLIHSSSIGSSAGAAVGGTEVTLWTPGPAANVSTRVEATFSGRISATAANTTAAIKVYCDGVAVAEWHIVIPLAGGPGQTDVTWTTVIAVTPGTHQWVVRALTVAGTGSMAALAGCQFTLREA